MDLSEIEKFRDPIWRISNLYSIRERGGKVITFRPRPQQLQVLTMIFRHGFKRIIILKARQIGFSTLLGVICADQLCWNTGKQISLVDKTQEDARQKLKNITMLAYDSLHPDLKETMKTKTLKERVEFLEARLEGAEDFLGILRERVEVLEVDYCRRVGPEQQKRDQYEVEHQFDDMSKTRRS